ncbi:DUF1045 domain-containing protein [Rickettsiella grylli]|uniref:DUF1868 domain-containing protein n=1 Tax=Rickettsiella grylli TaxID=59196 RepID=A8PK34_9COXI|nr:DUF1045 domain-containing protein [Rickettsiella grylli]EDP46484.1 hypothetical protein RICGR_0017 [Rickettsiella grylli]
MTISKHDCDELTIALIPSNEIVKEAIRLNNQLEQALEDIPNKQNLIHISLFQGRFRCSQLEKIGITLDNLTKPLDPFKLELDAELKESCTNLFWNIKENVQLLRLHTDILKAVSPYREGILPVFKDCYTQLSQAQQQLIDRYGTPHVLQNFNPHITVYYNVDHKKINCVAIKPQPSYLNFSATQLIVGHIGYDGNLEKIYKKFQL